MALMEVSYFSNVLGLTMTMNVIIPQQTSSQIGMVGASDYESYPTLYLLHGMSDDHSIWMRRTAIERYVSELGIAVVMPTTHLGWYTDTAYGLKYWQHISEELPKICREFFPRMSNKREETFVAGLSMGGYGAFKLGLGKSETFGAAASLSGALDIATAFVPGEMGEETPFWSGVFGSLEGVKGSDNDLLHLSSELIKRNRSVPRLFMWCGEQDFLYEQNQRALKHLEELGLEVTASFTEGDHSWVHWDEQIQVVLKWLLP
ncbi:alpha/beta hydrolase family protein [uncultured Vagococcus sp.]|uniref:alpha/beta hydrolase n=1 Tax=uncultured Vagococcus sp. TaxID=189676 RepID=UPI0028D5E1ED|nr:alpha/beta hydrolase family protein [uncultured Vagococcus sp.]